MISICIPIYNFNVTELVKTLSEQSKLLDCPSEIILIDDCSNSTFKNINESVCSKENYIQLEKNIGRAAIRNRFLEYAKYDYLLFLDCDSSVQNANFLENYIKEIKSGAAKVICGGRLYSSNRPIRNKILRWKYGISKESKPFSIRNSQPNKSFMTNNFVVLKEVFKIVKFDERINGYGHEDTFFGYELKKKGIEIFHINNPVLNGDLEENKNYIKSNEQAIANLIKILDFVNYDKAFIEDVNVLRIYYKFYKSRKLIALAFLIFRPIIKFLLIKGYANLYMFDFYKLGITTLKMKN